VALGPERGCLRRAPPDEDPDGDGTRLTLNLRFPGQQYDAATGLHYNYFRDYDPTVGRYLQSDPIGLLGGMSTYGYANGSPSTFTDPLGLRGKGLGGRLGAAIARPIIQRLGGGAAARAASMAAKARAEARRAADMAKRMQTVLGRIFKGRSKKGVEPAGCADVASNAGSSAAFGGRLYPENKLRQLVYYLERRGVSVYGTEGNPRFTPRRDGSGMMEFPANPTVLQVKHELTHFLDFRKFGFEAYRDMGRLGRESSVLERLQQNRVWSGLNRSEQDFSISYVERLRIEALKGHGI
jgi:RHS repeat-associated protein